MVATKLAALLLALTLSSAFTVAHSQLHNGRWKLLKRSIGVSAMHVALLPNDKVVVFDRTDFGASNISLPSGKCRDDADDRALRHDCSAHSVEFDPADRSVRPLTVLTDTWCSSGALAADGTLVQTGGFNDGVRAVRYFSPCEDCDWVEDKGGLAVRRWYASDHVLPDGRVIVVGGRGQFNYEFVPKALASDESTFELPFLRETKDAWENNLYPFVHLSPDGNLFVFANTKAILLDYARHKVVRNFPEMPGGIARNYPSSGSSVLLPLLLKNNALSDAIEAAVLICGGATPNSSSLAANGTFLPASNTCGRLTITEESPAWEMEEMPVGRVMGDMVLLPTGDVLIINGAARGSAGWAMGREPVLHPVLYRTGVAGDAHPRFEVLSPATTPRLYHSTAHLLSDGRVLVGGSNPNVKYEFTGVLFPTELSLEAFYPPYLGSKRVGAPRPKITRIEPGTEITHGERLSIEVRLRGGKEAGKVAVTMAAPAFTTHSFSMNQRLLVLNVERVGRAKGGCYLKVEGIAPASAALAPKGYYMLFVVHGGVPSRGRWIHIM